MMLEIALACIARGWHVFPCKGKEPLTKHAHKDASNDEAQVRAWWARTPDANVAIAPGPSGITVLDVDSGLDGEDSLRAFCEAHGIPETFAVRTGKRPQYRVQLYFAGAGTSLNGWEAGEYAGDLRGSWGYVMAAGCVHPESGERYEVLWDNPPAPVPNWVRSLVAAPRKDRDGNPLPPRTVGDGPIADFRNDSMIRLLGKKRAEGATDEGLREYAVQVNEDRMVPPLDESELERLIANACKFPIPEAEPVIVLGGKVAGEPEPPRDWREFYHTRAEHDNVGPPRFLIEDFLPEQAIMGIGAFVGQKKTLAALNIVFSLCSGEPLFGKYKVIRQPARVLYLGPENGLISFSDRVNRIGLRDYLCKSFFYATMSIQEKRPLTALTPEEIQDAAIIIDTAIRFTDGSENDAAMMKEFAEHAFSLIRNKAACVIMLHHSPKSMTKANELTLENSFRGTGELSAFLSVALAMRTQDMENEYESASLLRFVKQRDFEPRPSSFEVQTSRETCRMSFVDGSAGAVVTLQTTADRDGKDEAAFALMKANPQLSNIKMSKLLRDAGIKRSKEWVRVQRSERGAGCKLESGNNP
jgi:hypothetical protein